MTDVSKVTGPSGSPDNIKKEKAAADANKFQQEMRKRVTEVSQVDPDEQKKRKRSEEAEEEDDAASTEEGPATPASQVTPFSLEQSTKKESLMDMQKGGPGISPTESAQATPQGPSAPRTAFFQAPASDEMSDDSGTPEQGSFGQGASAPSAQPPSLPPDTSAQQQQQTEAQNQQAQQASQTQATSQDQQQGWTPEGQKPVTAGPPESGQAGQQQTGQQGQKPGQTQSGPPQGKDQEAGGSGFKLSSPLKEEQQKQAASTKMSAGLQQKPPAGTTAAALEGQQAQKVQDTSAFFEQMGKDDREGGKKGKQQAQQMEDTEEAAAQVQGPAPGTQPVAFAEAMEGVSEKKVDDKEKLSPMEAMGLQTGTGDAQIINAPPPAPETLTPYAVMNPQVQDIFDRMVGVMTVMNMSGMTETVITLNSPQFASSVFFGTQIIIQEFSTAPQAFNIQLNGTPQAVALFQGNADDLMAAFQSGNYNFRVNRLDTGYISDRPLFKRKEKAEGGKQGQTGDSPQ